MEVDRPESVTLKQLRGAYVIDVAIIRKVRAVSGEDKFETVGQDVITIDPGAEESVSCARFSLALGAFSARLWHKRAGYSHSSCVAKPILAPCFTQPHGL